MEVKDLTESLKFFNGKIKYNEPMNKHTTFKVGGLAEIFIKIDNIAELRETLKIAKKNKIPITIIGNGSNLLVLDKGIKGITLKIELKKIEIQEKKEQDKIQITVGAGEKIGNLAQYCLKEEITGMEELAGIPGTVRWSSKNECRSTW